MGSMSNPTPMPSEVAAHTAATIRSLTASQLADLMASSQKLQKRILPVCWDAVRTADPALADTLDALHASDTETDMPRFEALKSQHEASLDTAVKTPAGKATAGLIVGSLLVAAITIMAVFAGGPVSAIIAWALVSAGMLTAGILTGVRLARRSGNWMFSDPGLAASTVWDAGVDAAAAVALMHRSGTAGLTPDVLRALTSVWSGAGLPLTLLTVPAPVIAAPVVVAPAVAAKPVVKRAPRATSAAASARRPAVKPAPKPAPKAVTTATAPKRPAAKRVPKAVPVPAEPVVG